VQREPDDEEEERHSGPSPHERPGAGEECRVEAERQSGHCARVQRAEAGAPARRSIDLIGAPGLATEHERQGAEHEHEEHELDVQRLAGHLASLAFGGIPRTRDSVCTPKGPGRKGVVKRKRLTNR